MQHLSDLDWDLIAAYNCLMYAVALIVSVALVQHAVFFYSFPPDLSRWVAVNPTVYGLMALLLWFFFKALHRTEVKAEVARTLRHGGSP